MFFIAYNFSNFPSLLFALIPQANSVLETKNFDTEKTILFISSFIEWKILLFIIIWFFPASYQRKTSLRRSLFSLTGQSARFEARYMKNEGFIPVSRFFVSAGNPLVPTESLDDHCNKTVDIYVDVASPQVTYLNRHRPLTCWYRFKSIKGIPKDWVLRLTFKKFKVGTLINSTHCEGGYLQVSIIKNWIFCVSPHKSALLNLHKHHLKLRI